MREEMTKSGAFARPERGIYAASPDEWNSVSALFVSALANRPVKRHKCRAPVASGFTLIELILVMAILTVAVSITAPALSNFFHGRTLDSEARRMLSLTRQGQSRAVSEGLPMDLWIDSAQAQYGLEADASFEQTDPKAVTFSLDKDVQVQTVNVDPNAPLTTSTEPSAVESSSTATAANTSRHASLPRIRFLPDGSISELSPQLLRLTGRDGTLLEVALGRSRLNYEIRAQKTQ